MDDQINPQGQINIKPNFFFKNKYLIIFLVIFSAASFGTTGYLLTSNIKPPTIDKLPEQDTIPISTPAITAPNKAVNAPSPSPKLTISPAPSETATWSAFISNKYSYSIKYPPAWTATIAAQSDPKILEYVVFNPVATKAGTLSITLSYGTRTYAQALALDPQTGESIIVASVSATKKNSKDSNGNKAANIIVPFGANTIIFNAKDTFANLFNQMLSTLKLTK